MSEQHVYPLKMLAGETHRSRSASRTQKGWLSLRNCFVARVVDNSMKPVASKGQYVLASPGTSCWSSWAERAPIPGV